MSSMRDHGSWTLPPAPPQPPKKKRPLLAVCLTVVGLLLVSGAGYVVYKEVFYSRPVDPKWLAETSTPTPIPKVLTGGTRITQPVKKTEDLDEVCVGNTYTEAPKFAGVAPHHVAIADWYMPDLVTGDSTFSLRNPDKPLKVKTKHQAAWVPEDPAKVQAVLCVERYPTGEEVKIGQCEFLGETLPHHKATWDATLREVASGKVIAFARMDSDAECPSTTLVGEDKIVYQGMSDKALYEQFKSYVEG